MKLLLNVHSGNLRITFKKQYDIVAMSFHKNANGCFIVICFGNGSRSRVAFLMALEPQHSD